MTAIKPITTYKGKIAPLFNGSIDTDQITPKVHLKRISKSGFDLFAFDERRYLSDGSDNPDFSPSKPQHKGASILITGDNFGYGSGREHVAWALKDYGSHIIIAGSFNDIFYMSYAKSAMLFIVLKKSTREYLVQYVEIEVGLSNRTVSSPDKRFHSEIDETWKSKFVNGSNDIAIILRYESLVEKYEKSLQGS